MRLGHLLSTLSGATREQITLDIRADTEKLIGMLDRLVNQGNSVMLIELNLAVLAHADSIVDIGPGAGRDGGQIVFQGRRPGWPRPTP